MPADGDVIFRPPWYLLAFWFGMGAVMLAFGIAVVGPVIPAPDWARAVFVGLSSLALLSGLPLAFSFVRIRSDGIVNRHFRRWSVQWTDLEAWSQLGPRGSVYLRTRDDRVLGFSSWCVYTTRNDRLAQLLESRLGPGLTGEKAVMPAWLKAIFGGIHAR